MFDNPDIFYLDRPIFQGPWDLSETTIKQLKNSKLSIIDLSSEHWGAGGIESAYEKFNSLGINFLLLSHHPDDHKKFEHMLYYPHWYFWSVNRFVIPTGVTGPRQYLWSCLNASARHHRIQNYILSRKKSYFAQAKFSIHNTYADHIEHANNERLAPDVLEEWNAVRTFLPNRDTLESQRGTGYMTNLNIPEFNNSYVHLVTETNVDARIFISEKTWKPIAAKQIFLVFGNPGTIQTLREEGVDVFDDIVDHKYDCELDWRRRLDKLHQSLESLLLQDLPLIYQQTQTRREQNCFKFQHLQFNQRYQQDLLDAVARYS